MTIRIWLVSDLHLEDIDHEAWMPSAEPDFDILACAGDVVESDPVACVDAVARMARGRPAVMVLGNHDVWNLALQDALATARARNPAVHVLEGGESLTIGDVTFAGGTLWDDPDDWPSGIPRLKAPEATRSGEPVFVLDCGERRHATLRDLAEVHARTMDALADAKADVILTHYPPSQADLSRLSVPAVWLHGHRHTIQNEMSDGHRLVRMPCQKGINMIGALVELGSDPSRARVAPVVGLGRFAD